MNALALASAIAAHMPGWRPAPGHRPGPSCAFLTREDGARLYVGARPWGVEVRPVFPRDASGRKLREDPPGLVVDGRDARAVAGLIARGVLPGYLPVLAMARAEGGV